MMFASDTGLVKHVNIQHAGNWNGVERAWVGPILSRSDAEAPETCAMQGHYWIRDETNDNDSHTCSRCYAKRARTDSGVVYTQQHLILEEP
jgi:hypothetical protein